MSEGKKHRNPINFYETFKDKYEEIKIEKPDEFNKYKTRFFKYYEEGKYDDLDGVEGFIDSHKDLYEFIRERKKETFFNSLEGKKNIVEALKSTQEKITNELDLKNMFIYCKDLRKLKSLNPDIMSKIENRIEKLNEDYSKLDRQYAEVVEKEVRGREVLACGRPRLDNPGRLPIRGNDEP